MAGGCGWLVDIPLLRSVEFVEDDRVLYFPRVLGFLIFWPFVGHEPFISLGVGSSNTYKSKLGMLARRLHFMLFF